MSKMLTRAGLKLRKVEKCCGPLLPHVTACPYGKSERAARPPALSWRSDLISLLTALDRCSF